MPLKAHTTNVGSSLKGRAGQQPSLPRLQQNSSLHTGVRVPGRERWTASGELGEGLCNVTRGSSTSRTASPLGRPAGESGAEMRCKKHQNYIRKLSSIPFLPRET